MTEKMGLMALGLSMVLLSGCGGGGSNDPGSNDPKTVTGVFQDANVAGLNYACSSGKTDLTNSEGEYTCNVGDTVEFSLGGYVLGSVTATSGIVTPMSLYPNDLEAATDVLQLLQTLDSGEDGTITIPDNFSALDDVETQPGNADFDSDMEYELGEALVSEDDAQEHMLKTLLAGKTLYTTIWDDMGTMESWSFNSDMTQATWVELIGGSERGTNAISSVAGMTITIADDEGATEIMVKEILADYLVLEVRGGELGTEIETLRLYFDEAKARAYLLAGPPTVDLATLLGGKTFYVVGDDYLDRLVFNADVTSATWTTIAGHETGESGTDALRIEGSKIVLPEGGYVILAEATNEYLLFTDFDAEGNADGQGRFYFEQAKAEAYFATLGGGSSTSDLSALIVGHTYYTTACDSYEDGGQTIINNHVETLVFGANGIVTISWMENGEQITRTFNYTIEGGILTIITPEGTHVLENAHQSDEYILFAGGIK